MMNFKLIDRKELNKNIMDRKAIFDEDLIKFDEKELPGKCKNFILSDAFKINNENNSYYIDKENIMTFIGYIIINDNRDCNVKKVSEFIGFLQNSYKSEKYLIVELL